MLPHPKKRPKKPRKPPPTPPPSVRPGASAADALAREVLVYENRVAAVLYTAWWFDLCRRFGLQDAAVARAHGRTLPPADPEDGETCPAPASLADVYRHVGRETVEVTEAQRLRGRWTIYRTVHALYYASSRHRVAPPAYYWAMIREVWHALEVGPMHRKMLAWRTELPAAPAPALRELFVLRTFYDVVAKRAVDQVYLAMTRLTLNDGGPGQREQSLAETLQARFGRLLTRLRAQTQREPAPHPLTPAALEGLAVRAVAAAYASTDTTTVPLALFAPLGHGGGTSSSTSSDDDDGSGVDLARAIPLVARLVAGFHDDPVGTALFRLALEVGGRLAQYLPPLLRELAPEAAAIAQRATARARVLGGGTEQEGRARILLVAHRVTEWVEARRARVRREFLDLSLALDADIDNATLANRTTQYDVLLEALATTSFALRSQQATRPPPAPTKSPPRRSTDGHRTARATDPPPPRTHDRSLSRRTGQRQLASPTSSPALPTLSRQRSRSLSYAPSSAMNRSSSARDCQGLERK